MENTRRDFLASAFSMGALVATSQLPAFGKESRADRVIAESLATPAEAAETFADRGVYERLTLAYQHIAAGATKPFSILHISDTHFTAAYPHEGPDKLTTMRKRTLTFGGRQEQALRDSLAWAKAHVDYVLHTGDLIDWQSEANFDLVRKYFGAAFTPKAGVPKMFGSVGNHEFYTYLLGEKHTWQEPFKERSWPLLKGAYPIDARFESTVINGINFITLDDVFGTVQPDQVARFKQEVAKGLPIVLCMHVPFFTPLIWRAHEKYWSAPGTKFHAAAVPPARGDLKRQLEDKTTADFIAYLKGEPLLKAILAGHLHIDVQDRFSPTAMEYVVGGNFLFHGAEILFT